MRCETPRRGPVGGAAEWAAMLRRNSTLTRLSLADNSLTEQGGAELLSALLLALPPNGGSHWAG